MKEGYSTHPKDREHPERKDNEYFTGNIYKSDFMPKYPARLGKIAYDIQGNAIEDMLPTFSIKEEFDKWWNS